MVSCSSRGRASSERSIRHELKNPIVSVKGYCVLSASVASLLSSRGDTTEGTFEEALTYPPEDDARSRTSIRFDTRCRPSPTLARNSCSSIRAEIDSEPLEQPRSLWQTSHFGLGPALLLIILLVWLWGRRGEVEA